MTDRDLTPAEARAEVEAFMGEGWECIAGPYDPHDGAVPRPHVRAYFGDCIELAATEGTYRAAVAALKQAWRDAVRPWCVSSVAAGLMACNEEMPNCVHIANGVLGVNRACRKCNGSGRSYPLLGDGFGYCLPCDCDKRGGE